MPINIGGKSLPAGAYGAGFIPGSKFAVTHVGVHDVLTATCATNEVLKRPEPMQVLADQAGGSRLYEGRKYIHFSR